MASSLSGSGSSSRSLAPYNGPYLSQAPLRGIAGFLKYARDKGYLKPASHGTGSSSSKVAALTQKMRAPIERANIAVKLSVLMPYLDVRSVCRLSAVSHHFHFLKPKALEKRADAARDLITYLRGDISGLYTGDEKVLKTMQSLTLSGVRLNPEKIATIVELCPHLKELDLTDCHITDDCLAALRPLKDQLISLNLNKNDFLTDIGFRHLEGFSKLKKLFVDLITPEYGYVAIGGNTNATYTSIATLSQLEILHFTGRTRDPIRGVQIEELATNLSNLRELVLKDVKFENPLTLLRLPLFTKLEVLKILRRSNDGMRDAISENVIQEIGKMTHLKELDIRIGPAGAASRLDPLRSLIHVQKLSLDFYDGASQMKEGLHALLPALPHLTELTLRDCKLRDEELMPMIAQCPQLKKLSFMYDSAITGEEFHTLSHLSQLETVEFVRCDQLHSIIFTHLARHKKLTGLTLEDCRDISILEGDLREIESFGFKTLSINGCRKIHINEFATLLTKSPQVQHLSIDDEYLLAALICKNLRTLKYEGDVSDSFRVLAQLPHLVSIDYVESSEDMSDETKRILKDALPDLQITERGRKVFFSSDVPAESESDSDSSSDSDDD